MHAGCGHVTEAAESKPEARLGFTGYTEIKMLESEFARAGLSIRDTALPLNART